MQDGFALAGRVLRPALVGVSKGGPKVAPVEAPVEGVDKTV
jgi:molecular chaperone GrpE